MSAMIRDRQNITIHPLFADVLAGEFRAKCDPQKRKHTLGRLAYAACLKGDFKPYPNDARDPQSDTCDYKPSWANHTSVGVEVSANRPARSRVFVPQILGVTFAKTETDAGFMLNFNHTPNVFSLDVTVLPKDVTVPLSLTSPETIASARTTVTRLAEVLFSQ